MWIFAKVAKKIANNTLYYYVLEKVFILLRNCKIWLRSQAFNKGNLSCGKMSRKTDSDSPWQRINDVRLSNPQGDEQCGSCNFKRS